MPTAFDPPSNERGVGMLELLVAILILSFGILGIAALQARALSYSQLSTFRSQATALTDDVLDRMRADRVSARAGTWDTASNQPASRYGTTGTWADRELADWKHRVETLLPSGTASITAGTSSSATSPVRITVQIQWAERDRTVSTWSTEALL